MRLYIFDYALKWTPRAIVKTLKKTKLREVIKYIYPKGLTTTEIEAELDSTLLEYASFLMVKYSEHKQ